MRRSCGGYPIAATCSTLTASTSGFKTTPIARSAALVCLAPAGFRWIWVWIRARLRTWKGSRTFVETKNTW
ncbi:hypothetical protein LINPERHAP1_LOCUS13439 [Linum perenne]